MRKTGILLLVLGTLLFIFLAAASYRQATAILDAPARRSRIFNRVTLVERIKEQLHSAVIAGRAYLLTGDATYLAPYNEAIPAIRSDFKEIRSRYVRRPATEERLNNVETLINKRFNLFAKAIELRKRGGYSTRTRRIMTAQGAAQDGEITAAIDGWVSEDINISQQLEREVSASLQNLIRTAIEGIGLAVLLVTLILLLNRARNRALRESEADLRAILEGVYDALFIHDEKGKILNVNKKMLEMYGLTSEQAIGSSILQYLSAPENPADRLPDMWSRTMAGETVVKEWKARRSSDGTIFPVEVSLTRITLKSRGAILASVRDITERRKTEQELRELNRDFVIFLENATDFVYFKDRNSRFRFCSQTLANITGHSSWRDMIGKHDLEVFPEDVAQIYYEEEFPVFLNGIPLLNKTDPYYDAHGRKGWVSTNKWPVFDDENRVVGIFGMSRDVTERKKMEEEIRHMAQHDALTDLPNRRLLQEIIKIETAQAKRHQTKMALLLLDLDRFKEVNDTLGHEVGDELLKEVSARFKANIRASDTVSRTGGDEFTFVVADINKADDAADVAQKIVASLQKPFFISGHELHVTTSMGISIYPDDGEETDSLIRYADIAMYYAKEHGRNTFRFYNPAINNKSVERIRLESMLLRTVERGELVVYYQPQIEINSRKMICSEALVRWNHPDLGLLEAERFMRTAEETGYITVIDEWVLRTVCAQARKWLDAGVGPARITVNMSSREFKNTHVAQKIANILKEAGTPPEYVDIEITESLAMSDITRTVSRLRELAEMGVCALIDDFGTGYSSLSQLKRLPIQRLKIDQSFIKDIATDPDDRAIINAVTSMAHSMSMRVVAEGVETVDQLSFLRAAHCDEAQGFLFSKALPACEFEQAFLTR